MKNRTAMMELIATINANMINLGINDRYLIGLEHCKKHAEELLEKEKEQMISIMYEQIKHIDYEGMGDIIYRRVPEEIYNETYKQD